jgi:hypothetical protein
MPTVSDACSLSFWPRDLSFPGTPSFLCHCGFPSEHSSLCSCLCEAQNAQQLHERIQSSSMDAKLEALKFINLDGISLLTQMVESGTE